MNIWEIEEKTNKDSDGLIPKNQPAPKKEPAPKIQTGNKDDIVERNDQKIETDDGRQLLL